MSKGLTQGAITLVVRCTRSLVIQLLSLLSGCYPLISCCDHSLPSFHPLLSGCFPLLPLLCGCYHCYPVIRYTEFSPVITPWLHLFLKSCFSAKLTLAIGLLRVTVLVAYFSSGKASPSFPSSALRSAILMI